MNHSVCEVAATSSVSETKQTFFRVVMGGRLFFQPDCSQMCVAGRDQPAKDVAGGRPARKTRRGWLRPVRSSQKWLAGQKKIWPVAKPPEKCGSEQPENTWLVGDQPPKHLAAVFAVFFQTVSATKTRGQNMAEKKAFIFYYHFSPYLWPKNDQL